MAYQVISQNNTTTTLADENGNVIRVPARVSLATSTDYTITKVNNSTATLEDGNGNIIRDVPCVAVLVGGEGGGGSGLPDQTGHSGEFLTTDGTGASWSNKPLVNTATGTNSLCVDLGHNIPTWTGATIYGAWSSSLGNYSTSLGYQCRAGTYSVSIGYNCYVQGKYSIAIGYQASTDYYNNTIMINASGTPQANRDANTVKIANANGNFEIMSADGTIPEARLADTTNAAQGQVLALDSNLDAVWTTPSGGLPSQTGNAGKFLTTDGTDASWSDKPLVNMATGTDSLTILGFGTSDSYSIGIGAQSQASGNLGVSIGYNARNFGSNNGRIAIGSNTYNSGGSYSIAIGYYARTGAEKAIQINVSGQSVTNSDANTVKIANANGNFEMMSADGTIPTARLTKVNTTVTLTAAGWSGGSQSVTVAGITATGVVLVSPDPTDQSAYTSAGVLCSAQGTDSLTFTATTTPSADIDVVVVAM